MKKLILQHWTGELDELAKISAENIKEYAKMVGSDYHFIEGNQFHRSATRPPLQKLALLNKEFDDYDVVVMTDMDMVVKKGANQSIFDDESGIGVRAFHEDRVKRNCIAAKPFWFDMSYCYWGGSTTRWNKEMRIKFREQLNPAEIAFFDTDRYAVDEGMMYRLSCKVGLVDAGKNSKYHFDGLKWQHPSFLTEGLDRAQLVHIRGKGKTKIERYRELKERGIV